MAGGDLLMVHFFDTYQRSGAYDGETYIHIYLGDALLIQQYT